MPTPQQLKEWDKAFSRIERVNDYQHLKRHLNSIEYQIETLTDDIDGFLTPRNEKEDVIQQHEKYKLQMLVKQKTRLEKQLNLLAKQIEVDIENSKNE